MIIVLGKPHLSKNSKALEVEVYILFPTAGIILAIHGYCHLTWLHTPARRRSNLQQEVDNNKISEN